MSRLVAFCCLAALTLPACGGGGGDAYGCNGHVCKATFQGPGALDLSERLGKGATVEVVAVDGASATVRIAGRDAKLVRDERQRVAGYDVTLSEVHGDDVTLRIVGT